MVRFKAPRIRKKTFGDQRLIRIEKTSLPLVVAVAFIAALISFVALKWVGEYMGFVVTINGVEVSYAPLLPLAIDGFGIICALGIVRHHGAPVDELTSNYDKFKHSFRNASEWGGLAVSLVLSMAGNIVHTLNRVDGSVPPRWLIVAYSIAIPGIVAYSLHLLGRAAHDSILARINVDDPDHIQMDVEGAAVPAPRPAAPSTPRQTAPASTAQTAPSRPATAPRPAAEAVAQARTAPASARMADDEATVFEQYRADRAAGKEWTGKQIADTLGMHEGAGRKKRARWNALIDELVAAGGQRAPFDQTVTPERDADRAAS